MTTTPTGLSLVQKLQSRITELEAIAAEAMEARDLIGELKARIAGLEAGQIIDGEGNIISPKEWAATKLKAAVLAEREACLAIMRSSSNWYDAIAAIRARNE